MLSISSLTAFCFLRMSTASLSFSLVLVITNIVYSYYIYEQEDAIAYALDHLEERTWAVIALDEAADGLVDYTIRMNFTVVPNTNTVVDMIAIGLDPRCVFHPLRAKTKIMDCDVAMGMLSHPSTVRVVKPK